jgi:hypothetical protein
MNRSVVMEAEAVLQPRAASENPREVRRFMVKKKHGRAGRFSIDKDRGKKVLLAE